MTAAGAPGGRCQGEPGGIRTAPDVGGPWDVPYVDRPESPRQVQPLERELDVLLLGRGSDHVAPAVPQNEDHQ